MAEPTPIQTPAPPVLTYNGIPASQVVLTTPSTKYHLADVLGLHDEVRVAYASLGATVEFWSGADLLRVWLIPNHEITSIKVEVNCDIMREIRQMQAAKENTAAVAVAPKPTTDAP
jgi:hypothetical protein